MLSPLLGTLAPLSTATAYGPTYLLGPFRFATNQAAPLPSPYTEAGAVGSLTVVQSAGVIAVSGGAVSMTGENSTTGTRLYASANLARQVGRALLLDRISGVSNNEAGWMNATGNWDSGADVRYGGSITNYGALVSTGLSSAYAIVMRAAGHWWFGYDGTVWRLLYVSNIGSEATRRPALIQYGPTPNVSDNVRVADLPAPWTDDYGIATNRVASPSAGATTTAEANALVEFAWTAATGATLELDVRRTDDDNRWIVRGDQAGSTIKLIERNAGVETERGSAAQTWTNGTAYRVVVIADAATIRVCTSSNTVANDAQKLSYASANFNSTATGVKVSRAGSNLIAWPRVLSGAALAALQAV